jgi:2-isopropylmalate synthase
LKHRLSVLGYNITKEELDSVYDKFLSLADGKKNIDDEDLEHLMGDKKKEKVNATLDLLQVISGKDLIPVAIVKLDINGEKFEASESGIGAIDAAIKATQSILNREVTVHELLIQTFTRSSQEVGKIHIQLDFEGKIYYGFGSHDDIVTAAVEAYLDASNKMAPVEVNHELSV